MDQAALDRRRGRELAQPGLAHRHVVGRLQQPVVAGIGDLDQLGDVPGGVGHDLHQAQRTLGAAGVRVEAALGADHGVDQAGVEPVAAGRLPCGHGQPRRLARRPARAGPAPAAAEGSSRVAGDRGQVLDEVGGRAHGQAAQLGVGQLALAHRGQGQDPPGRRDSAPAGRACRWRRGARPSRTRPRRRASAAPAARRIRRCPAAAMRSSGTTSCGRRARRLARAAQNAARAWAGGSSRGVVGQAGEAVGRAGTPRRRARPRGPSCQSVAAHRRRPTASGAARLWPAPAGLRPSASLWMRGACGRSA